MRKPLLYQSFKILRFLLFLRYKNVLRQPVQVSFYSLLFLSTVLNTFLFAFIISEMKLEAASLSDVFYIMLLLFALLLFVFERVISYTPYHIVFPNSYPLSTIQKLMIELSYEALSPVNTLLGISLLVISLICHQNIIIGLGSFFLGSTAIRLVILVVSILIENPQSCVILYLLVCCVLFTLGIIHLVKYRSLLLVFFALILFLINLKLYKKNAYQ